MSDKGYIHIYTGNGKGKTTAALGLALRMSGTGQHVFVAQFVKSMQYAEIETINRHLPLIDHKQYGYGCFIDKKATEKDREAAQEGLWELENILLSKKYKLVILDELNIALYYNLIDLKDVIEIIKKKPYETELVITGRYAPKELIDLADLVTEMQEVKHYYTKGILSRKGVEY